MSDRSLPLSERGPDLRYTNERAREMEQSVKGFAALVNDDLYDLLKWAESLRAAAVRYRNALYAIVNTTGDEHYAAIAAARRIAREDGCVGQPTEKRRTHAA